jgi:hypothetical protein
MVAAHLADEKGKEIYFFQDSGQKIRKESPSTKSETKTKHLLSPPPPPSISDKSLPPLPVSKSKMEGVLELLSY